MGVVIRSAGWVRRVRRGECLELVGGRGPCTAADCLLLWSGLLCYVQATASEGRRWNNALAAVLRRDQGQQTLSTRPASSNSNTSGAASGVVHAKFAP